MIDFSPIQILLVLVIALIVFGPKRLPEMGRSVGRGIREFKSAIMDDPPAREREEQPAATATVAAAQPEDDVLEGVVVSGDAPPRGPQDT
ncbi:MAG: twin-arginine translocase TatA/TatE family subunit [Thermoleophilia bacterium]